MSENTARVAPPKRRRPWRYYNILIHRYLGYFFAGTTCVYAISGLAVNHIEDWNPNYSISHQKQKFDPLADPENLSVQEANVILQSFALKTPFNADNVFYPDENSIEILLSAHQKIRLNTTTGNADLETTSRRPALHLFNFLHLNNAKQAWTLYADIYAIALLLLALSGLLMKKAKKGLWGEAGIWTLAGMVLPVVLVLIYYRP